MLWIIRKPFAVPAVVRESTLISDLRRLWDRQAAYLEADSSYSYDLEALGFTASRGVRVDVLEATAEGFSAIASGGGHECVLYEGAARPPRSYAQVAGDVACRG